MSALFQLPKQVPLSGGNILPGAKLTFSQTGTSTLQNTYQDEDRTTPHANPVVADANGVFEPIYLDPTLPHYRVRLTTADDALEYQVDDVPSNQNVQQSVRMESENPFVFLYDTDGTSGSRKYRIRAAGAAFEVQAVNEAENVFTTILRYEAGILYSNETEVAVTTSGSFTATLTTFSSALTGTINYRRVNNLVSLWTTSAISGTSSSNDLIISGLPTQLRPATGVYASCIATDNGDSGLAALAAVGSGGSIVMFLGGTSGVANRLQFTSGFTSSGTKGIPAGWSITYPLS